MSEELKELVKRLEDEIERLRERVELVEARPWYPLWVSTPPPKPNWYKPVLYWESNRTWPVQTLTNGTGW